MIYEKNSLHFYYCGYEKCEAGHSFGPAVRAQYLIHFIVNGKGQYNVGNKKLTVSKNHAFLIRPKEVTFYEADMENPWEYLWFAFDGKEADSLVSAFFGSGNSYTACADDTIRLNKLMLSSIPYFQSRRRSQLELRGWCYLFFSCFKNCGVNGSTVKENTYVCEAINYVRYNYMHDISVEQISSYLGINRTYLYKILKDYTGVSPKEYITLRRIEAAKNMLQYSNYDITGIALSCGFRDHSSFCKVFRQYERQTPSQYQRQFHHKKR